MSFSLNSGDIGPTMEIVCTKAGLPVVFTSATPVLYVKKPSGAHAQLAGTYAVTSAVRGAFSFRPTASTVIDEVGEWEIQPRITDGGMDACMDSFTVEVRYHYSVDSEDADLPIALLGISGG